MNLFRDHVRAIASLRVAWLTLVLVCTSANRESCAETIIDFDDLTASASGTLFAGDTYASSGVTFTSGVIGDAFRLQILDIEVNDRVRLNSPDDQFLVFGNEGSVSPPNFLTASSISRSRKDVLITFSTPITSLRLTIDDFTVGTPSVVRLIALSHADDPTEFVVLEIAEHPVGNASEPNGVLSVTSGGHAFTHAAFQTTTQRKGLDNITFTAVPEPPTTLLFIVIGLVTTMYRRLRTESVE